MLRSNNSKRIPAASLVSALSLMCAMPAMAQTNDNIINVESQPLGQALNELAGQTGVVIIAPTELVSGKIAPAVSVTGDVRAALDILLEDTGLSVRQNVSGAFILSEEVQESQSMTAPEARPATVQEQSSAAPTRNEIQPLVADTVVVTGIRGALQTAISQKRAADQVIDSISAEDLGKYPDENLAESLQRVTGLSISREGGEGSRVSVRGLSPDLTRVTLNGQTVATASGGRDFDFQTIASDVVNGVEVIKSPTADMDEGGIGATVNIKTPMPLDIGKRKFVASIKAVHDDLSAETSPRASVIYSDVMGQNDDFGVFLGLSYSERKLREDVFFATWERRDISDFDPALGLVEDPFTPRNIQPRLEQDDRERINLNTALQWDINDSLKSSVSATYTNLESLQTGARIPYRVFRTRTRNGNFAFDDVSVVGDTITAATVNDPGIRLRNNFDNRTTETYVLGADLEWTGDVWTVSGELGYTQAELEQEQFQVSFENRFGLAYDVGSGANSPESFTITPAVDLSDHAAFDFDRFQGTPAQIEDDETSFQIDLERRFEGDFIYDIKFGAKIKERTNEIFTIREQIRGLDIAYADFATAFPEDDFLSGFNNIPTSWATGDVLALRDRVRELNGGELEFLFQPLESGDVIEESSAGYVMANFGNDDGRFPWKANLGVRAVETQTTSSGFQTTDPDDQNATPVTESNTYTDVLPSFNIVVDLSDDLVFRAAAAKVMTRPTLSDIRLSQLINSGQLQAFVTNPSLDPFRATQLDTTLEWYFDEGALFSIGVFYKDIESFITEVTTDNVDLGIDTTSPDASGVPDGINDLFQVVQVTNGLGAEVSGIEVSYQQNFTFLPEPLDGFGALLNYTYADSSSNFVDQVTGGELPLPGQSENTFNAILFYEKDKLGARVSYNYRDGFLDTPVGDGGLPVFEEEFGQIDFSLSYAFTDRLSASIEGINVNDETRTQYAGNPLRLAYFEQTGARYLFGLRYNY